MTKTMAAVALVSLCLGFGATPGQNPRQPPPRFRAGIDLIVLDVSVLDAKRQPVNGLTAADFKILEDGREQDISSFTAVDVPDTLRRTASGGWTQEVEPDVQRNDEYPAAGGVFVIVMDDATPMPVEDVSTARNAARAVVERLGPAAIGAVVFAFNKDAGQEFTRDRSRLLAAIDRFNGSIELPGASGETVPFDRLDPRAETLYLLSVSTLRGAAEHLQRLPQRRKALVFVSVGLPLDPQLSAPVLGPTQEGSVSSQLIARLREAIQAAQRANVNIYGIDPGGLRAPRVVYSWMTGQSRLEGNPGKLNREYLAALSDETGGFAIMNTNDAGPRITQMLRENTSYYLLGYRSSNARTAGRYRRVKVSVNRSGLTVRTRDGYFEPLGHETSSPTGTPSASTALEQAFAGLLPASTLSLRLTAAPFAIAEAPGAALALVLGVRQKAVQEESEDRVDVLVRAFDEHRRTVASDRLSAKVTLRSAESGDVAYEVPWRLDLKPGRYHLRIAAESSLTGRTGGVYYDVEVPDFAREAVALSGVVVSAPHDTAAASSAGPIATLLPVMPTVERSFARDTAVRAFFRVYQGGAGKIGPATAYTTIRDAGGAIVFQRTETLERDRFSAQKAADLFVELPVSTLPAGPQLLTVEATRGKHVVRRQIVFAIR